MFKTLRQSRSNDGLQALARAALSYCAMIDSYYLPCLWYVLCANTRTNPQVNETLTVYKGTFGGKTVVFASAGVGTVFAATTATVLVAKFGCEAVVFTGVAGGLLEGQHVGDIVLATDCVNYDMDVTAFVPFPGCKFERGQVRTRTSVVLCSCIRIFLKQKKLFFFFGVSFKHNESDSKFSGYHFVEIHIEYLLPFLPPLSYRSSIGGSILQTHTCCNWRKRLRNPRASKLRSSLYSGGAEKSNDALVVFLMRVCVCVDSCAALSVIS